MSAWNIYSTLTWKLKQLNQADFGLCGWMRFQTNAGFLNIDKISYTRRTQINKTFIISFRTTCFRKKSPFVLVFNVTSFLKIIHAFYNRIFLKLLFRCEILPIFVLNRCCNEAFFRVSRITLMIRFSTRRYSACISKFILI